MKPPSFLAVSLMGNLALAAVWVAVRQRVNSQDGCPIIRDIPAGNFAAAKPSPPATETPGMATPWSRIESADYHQYIANLRAVGCPEWLIRDIIVAAIDDSYQQKNKSDPGSFPPWLGADQRRQASRSQSAKLVCVASGKTGAGQVVARIRMGQPGQ